LFNRFISEWIKSVQQINFVKYSKLEESKLTQQQINQRLHETTATLNKTEERLRRSEHAQKELVKQMKDLCFLCNRTIV